MKQSIQFFFKASRFHVLSSEPVECDRIDIFKDFLKEDELKE